MRKISFPLRNFPNAYVAPNDVSSRTNGKYIVNCESRVSREIAIDLTAQFFFLECTFDVMRNKSIVIKGFPYTYLSTYPFTYFLPFLSRPFFPAFLFQSRQIHPGNIFTFKRYIFGSKVLPIFRNNNSLLARTRRREEIP